MHYITDSLKELNRLVLEGKTLEAFDTYYHDDVVMQENELPATVGKPANRLRELDFLHQLTHFRKAEVLDLAVGDNVSFVVWHYDFTHAEWGVRNYTQVSVQHWKDGLIIHEKFYYPN